jgi:hypothetical protein
MGTAWYATGNYINDDGEVLNILNNFNQYSFTAYAELSTPSDITIKFGMQYEATNYHNPS